MRGFIALCLLAVWSGTINSLPSYSEDGPSSSNDVRSHLEKLEEFMEGRKKDTAKILKGEKDTNPGIFGNIPKADEMFEGDIIMDDDLRNAVLGKADKRTVITAKEKFWPRGVVPYVFDKKIDKKSKWCVYNAFIAFRKHTCIKFVRRTTQKYYIFIRSNPHYCASYVGRRGEKQPAQPVTIGHGCTRTGTCEHELLHALGMIHEQSRSDRDDHININWQNIRKKEQHNFNKYKYAMTNDEGVVYDYNSVMHYPNRAFGIDRSVPTIESKLDPSLKFGQRISFSVGDVKTINRAYKCARDKKSDELVQTLSDVEVKEDLIAKENSQSEY